MTTPARGPRSLRWAVALAGGLAACPAGAALVPAEFVDESIGGPMAEAVNFDFLPDGRILVVERATARIRVVPPGSPAPPLVAGTVDDVGAGFAEQGLLGIAVDPRWPQKPYVYVHHSSASSPNIKVARFAVEGDLDGTGDGGLTLDSLSRRDVLADIPDDFANHNGGTIVFGPDDMLYVALGEDAVPCAAQDIHELRGKILRIDVRGIPDGPGPVWPYVLIAPSDNPWATDADPRARLVWHRGLRNPWTIDFEPNTGQLAIADVGNDEWEEINVTTGRGLNFGWPLFEGPDVFIPCPGSDLGGLTLPAIAVPHPESRTIVLGGIARRADDPRDSFPVDHWGDIFYLDYYDGWLRRIEPDGNAWVPAGPVPGQPSPTDWGQGFVFVPRMRFGGDGGLWYLQAGELRRIRYTGKLVAADAPLPADRAEFTAVAPSPASGPVSLEFVLPAAGVAHLEVFDLRGRRVRSLLSGAELAAGPHRRTWDNRDDAGRTAPPGVYFGVLRAGGSPVSRRIVLVGE